MSTRQTQKTLAKYVNSATDLAEAVKWCVQHNNNVLDDNAVLKLNEFAIAANAVKDLTEELNTKVRRFDN